MVLAGVDDDAFMQAAFVGPDHVVIAATALDGAEGGGHGGARVRWHQSDHAQFHHVVDVCAAECAVVADTVDTEFGAGGQPVDHGQGDTGFAFVALAGRNGRGVENDAQVAGGIGPGTHDRELAAVTEFL